MTSSAAPATRSSRVIDDAVDRHFVRRGRGAEFDMEVDWIRANLPSTGARVIDIGCGAGALFDAIGRERAVGIDHSEQGLSRTRQVRGAAPVLCADTRRIPFADQTVDAVTVQHVIEHLTDCDAACREWRRLLKPGGVLLVLTPNVRFVDPSVFDDDTHVHLFDGSDLRDTLSAAGFEIIDLRTLGLPWCRWYHRLPSGWRLRRFVTTRARGLSQVPFCRWRGQTLCCAARSPTR